MSVVLAIPDLHCPFEHKDALAFLRAVKLREKPDRVVCLGDELDMAAVSEYDHDPNGLSAGDELKAGLAHLAKLYALFPEVVSCESNHTSRPYRKAFKHGIPREYLRDYHDFMHAPKGWKWADGADIDGVHYCHGEGFSGKEGAIKAALANMQSTVIGHLHSWAGIQWYANSSHLVYGFNVGCLIDRHAYPFKYGKHSPAKPILGCGIIRNGIPTFIPMLLNRSGRWVGHL